MYQHILVPVDGSATSNAGLDEAIKIAKALGSQLRLLHVVDQMPLAMSAEGFGTGSFDLLGMLKEAGARILADAKGRALAAGVAADTMLIDGPGSRLSEHVVTVARQWPADLVVIGTHGRRGIGRVLLGSDAEQVVRQAPVPVLLYRAGEPASSAAG